MEIETRPPRPRLRIKLSKDPSKSSFCKNCSKNIFGHDGDNQSKCTCQMSAVPKSCADDECATEEDEEISPTSNGTRRKAISPSSPGDHVPVAKKSSSKRAISSTDRGEYEQIRRNRRKGIPNRSPLY